MKFFLKSILFSSTMSQPQDVCENCYRPTCQWNCMIERIMFILTVHTKKDQKKMLQYTDKEEVRHATEMIKRKKVCELKSKVKK